MKRLRATSRWVSPRSTRGPLGGLDDAGDDVERPRPVDAAGLGVDGERDPQREDVGRRRRLAGPQLIEPEVVDDGEQLVRRRPGPAVGVAQLVPGWAGRGSRSSSGADTRRAVFRHREVSCRTHHRPRAGSVSAIMSAVVSSPTVAGSVGAPAVVPAAAAHSVGADGGHLDPPTSPWQVLSSPLSRLVVVALAFLAFALAAAIDRRVDAAARRSADRAIRGRQSLGVARRHVPADLVLREHTGGAGRWAHPGDRRLATMPDGGRAGRRGHARPTAARGHVEGEHRA